MKKLFYNARIHTPEDPGHAPSGSAQKNIRQYPKGALLVHNGVISQIGNEEELRKEIVRNETIIDQEIDCSGRCLIPGFVDPHTHMCFARRREEEFARRLGGASYLEILEKGGGILSSVRSVQEATDRELIDNTVSHALSALSYGTTTVEMKSGYGLDADQELRMLAVISQVAKTTPLTVVPTFMGAHAIPQEDKENPDRFVDRVVREMLPQVASQGIARFCDVFCEQGVFSIEQSRRVLAAAREHGLGLKIHADEVHDLGGAGLAAEMEATSAEHLLAAGEENLRQMAAKGVIGVILPATAYSLKKPYAPVRKMIEMDVPVALATDCNPGSSYTESMPFIFGLAVMNMDMDVEEALTAATLNAAYAIGEERRSGSLDAGKNADFLLLDGATPAILAYHAGVPSVQAVYKLGERVV
ncbi:MAG: imidazolonepropionase [Synergistales bacterium]|nr:imidazolonepropionase [Synergistales bacterium]